MNICTLKKYNTWDEIKIFCENCKFTNQYFVYNENKIVLSKNNNLVTLHIDKYTQESIESIINDLPTNIDNLLINITDTTQTFFLEKIFINLPITLKIIKFYYKQGKLSEMKTMESNGIFNVLFGIKIPFNCKILIEYDEIEYHVKYNIHDTELELVSNNELYKIQYIKCIAFVPFNFWFISNPGIALPLVALQNTDV